MKIFIIVGMPGSRKNLARSYAESKHIPYFATGSLVRAGVEKRGLDPPLKIPVGFPPGFGARTEWR